MGFVNQQPTTWIREDQPFKNDERLTRPTKIRRVGRGFYAEGRVVEPGEIVKVDAVTAADMVAFGKAIYV